MKSKRKPVFQNNITRPADMMRYRTGGATQNHAQRGAATRAMALLPAGKQYAAKDNGNGYDASKDKALVGGIIDPWCFIADSYDDDCGMISQERWLKIRTWLEREAKPDPLVVVATMLSMAQAKRVCHKCRKEIPEDKPAFNWSVDRNLYCGKCYGELPPPPKPVEVKSIEVKPIEVKPAKVDPLLKDLRTMQALLPQALQDKAEVKPAVDKSLLVHDTEIIEFPALETELGQTRYSKHRHEIEARTYHWSGGWGRTIKVKEAKVEAPKLAVAA